MKGRDFMSQSKPELPLTNLPDAYDNLINYMDVSPTEQPYIDQYQDLCTAKDFVAAKALYDSRPNFKLMIPNAETLNKLQQQIQALAETWVDEIDDYILGVRDFKGVYSQFTTYPKYSVVTYNGLWYGVYKVGTPQGTLPTDNNYWFAMQLKGDTGVGIGLTPSGYWNPTTPYIQNNLVMHNFILWQCLTNNTNSEPTMSNANWLKVWAVTSDANLIADEHTGLHYEIVMKDGKPFYRETTTILTSLAAMRDEGTGDMWKLYFNNETLRIRKVG